MRTNKVYNYREFAKILQNNNFVINEDNIVLLEIRNYNKQGNRKWRVALLRVGFHMQIAVYIGVQRLVQQLLIVLAILGVLLISYFISTWVLFNKSASA